MSPTENPMAEDTLFVRMLLIPGSLIARLYVPQNLDLVKLSIGKCSRANRLPPRSRPLPAGELSTDVLEDSAVPLEMEPIRDTGEVQRNNFAPVERDCTNTAR